MGGCLSSRSSRRSSLPLEAPAMYSASSSAASRSLKSRKKQKRGGGGTGFFDRRSTAAGGGGEFVEDELHRVPGRMFLNGASEVACMFTQQGRKGTNQDAMVVWENFTLRDDTIFCGVFDGHGPFGHMVAKKVRDSLPLKLSSQWRANMSGSNSPHQNGSVHGSGNSEETASITFDDDYGDSGAVNENEKLPEKYLSLKQSFLKSFKSMDKDLKLHPTIDCFCSGTTAVTVVKQGQDLIIGNVGDSRAILGTRDKDNNLVAVQLTVDLKPNLPREAARIHQCKGRVFALQDEPEVARVWLPNNDSPGLAMARAFGDFCLKDYGLISVPDISYRLLMEKDEFIVLATDGIWDVLSNKEVVDIVSSAPTRATASRALVDCAVRAWRMKFPTSKIDDCAAVCLFFDHPPPDQVPESDSMKPPEEPAETSVIGATAPEAENKNADQLIDGVARTYGSGLNRSSTFHDADEIVSVSDDPKIEKISGRSQSTRSLADCISATEEEEWSALEGVTRVNSLLNLPRFLSGNKRSASWKKR